MYTTAILSAFGYSLLLAVIFLAIELMFGFERDHNGKLRLKNPMITAWMTGSIFVFFLIVSIPYSLFEAHRKNDFNNFKNACAQQHNGTLYFDGSTTSAKPHCIAPHSVKTVITKE